MTTHEQAARNAEIVQRRLGGEATGALAREYGVTATRIGQLVRRYREKAGEIPNVSRRKMSPAAVRPRLRLVGPGIWECADAAVMRTAGTPKAAYDLWIAAAIIAAQPAKRALAPVATFEPLPPFAGPVTVVAGTKVAPRALSMSPSMRFAMERAGLAQRPIRSLAGA